MRKMRKMRKLAMQEQKWLLSRAFIYEDYRPGCPHCSGDGSFTVYIQGEYVPDRISRKVSVACYCYEEMEEVKAVWRAAVRHM